MTARKRGPKSTAAGLSALAKVADGRIFAPQSVQACCNPRQSAQRQAFCHLPAAVRKNFELGLQGPAKDFRDELLNLQLLIQDKSQQIGSPERPIQGSFSAQPCCWRV